MCLQPRARKQVAGAMFGRERFFPQLAMSSLLQGTGNLPPERSQRTRLWRLCAHRVTEEAGKWSYSKWPNENMLLTTSRRIVALWDFMQSNLQGVAGEFGPSLEADGWEQQNENNAWKERIMFQE